MSLFLTQCPSCETSFKVNEEQLEAANGVVRCGACNEVFLAGQHRIYLKEKVTDEKIETRLVESQPEPAVQASDEFTDDEPFITEDPWTDYQDSETGKGDGMTGVDAPLETFSAISSPREDIPDSEDESPGNEFVDTATDEHQESISQAGSPSWEDLDESGNDAPSPEESKETDLHNDIPSETTAENVEARTKENPIQSATNGPSTPPAIDSTRNGIDTYNQFLNPLAYTFTSYSASHELPGLEKTVREEPALPDERDALQSYPDISTDQDIGEAANEFAGDPWIFHEEETESPSMEKNVSLENPDTPDELVTPDEDVGPDEETRSGEGLSSPGIASEEETIPETTQSQWVEKELPEESDDSFSENEHMTDNEVISSPDLQEEIPASPEEKLTEENETSEEVTPAEYVPENPVSDIDEEAPVFSHADSSPGEDTHRPSLSPETPVIADLTGNAHGIVPDIVASEAIPVMTTKVVLPARSTRQEPPLTRNNVQDPSGVLQASRQDIDDKAALRDRLSDLSDEDALDPIEQEQLQAIDEAPVELVLTEDPFRVLKTAGLLLVSILLTGGLAFQYLWHNLDTLVIEEKYPAVTELLCQYRTCPDISRVDITQLTTENLAVRSHPEVANALQVDFVFRNDADREQPFPLVELNFTENSGSVIANRIFTVEEYLPSDMRLFTHMPAHSSLQVSLDLVNPGDQATGYSLTFRNP